MIKKSNVITYKDKLKWNRYLNSMEYKDIYFTPEYCKIYQDNGDGEARLYKYEDENIIVIYPFLCREINKIKEFSNLEEKLYDISTPYGYGGPIISIKNETANDKLENSIKDFSDEFHKYCISENIVSEFIRFHPIFQNQENFNHVYKIKYHNKTVYNDVNKDIEEIWIKEFKRANRNSIRKARKNGVDVFLCSPESENYETVLNKFKELYYSTMDRNSASDYYYFNKFYFNNFKKLLKENHKIFYAVYNGKIIAAHIVMFNDKYVHMHLSASDKNYLDVSPNNILDYEIIKWANYNGFKFVHQGGGTTPDLNDSLFKYKASFSKSTLDFHLGYKIHNEDIYRMLCGLNTNVQNNNETDLYKPEEISYFPLYRYNL